MLTRTPWLIAVVMWLCSTQTLAQAPRLLGYQGRLLGADGTPVSGMHSLKFSIFATAADATPKWEETQQLGLSDGYYATVLGSVTALPADVFDGTERFLELSVDSGAGLKPRQRVVSVPYALNAHTAKELAGGAINATSISVNGTTVVDATGKVPLTALANCTTANEGPVWDGTQWTCGTVSGPTGPKGDKGDKGDTGAQGPQGSAASIPTGMIAFFAGACPSGWTEYTALRGRFLVGTPSGGTAAGTVGTALTDLENRAHTHGYSEVPSHTHSLSVSGNTNTTGAHSHSGTTGSENSPEIYYDTPSGRFLTPGGSGAWIGVARVDGTSGSHHEHSFGTDSQGNHAHSFSFSGTSGSTGVATPTTSAGNAGVPYLQLTACVAP